MRRLLVLALVLVAAPASAQFVAGTLPQLPAELGPNGGLKVECIAGTCTGSGGVGADVNVSSIGGNAVTTTLPVSGTVTFSNSSIAVTHANFANLDAALSTLANQATLALIKAKTDNLDVLLSTRTKPADSQHATIDNASLAVTGTFWQNTQPVSLATLPALVAGSAVIGHVIVDTAPTTAVTGPLTDTQLRATPVPVSGTVTASVTGTVTANAGTNLNTSLLALEAGGNLASIKTDVDKIPSQGQAAMAASTPVAIASNQSAVPVSGTFYQATQPISGTVTAAVSNGVTAGLAGAPSLDVVTMQGVANGMPQYVWSIRGLPLQPCNKVRVNNCRGVSQ